MTPAIHETWERRFLIDVAFLGASPNDCWRWTGATTRAGYGVLWVDGKLEGAHRLSLRMAGTSLTNGDVVCHRCDNPGCVNPGHLFVGTQRDNIADMRAKGRHAHGTRTPNARLDERAIGQIRSLRAAGLYHRQIAAVLGVSRPTVSAVLRGETWKHVENDHDEPR